MLDDSLSMRRMTTTYTEGTLILSRDTTQDSKLLESLNFQGFSVTSSDFIISLYCMRSIHICKKVAMASSRNYNNEEPQKDDENEDQPEELPDLNEPPPIVSRPLTLEEFESEQRQDRVERMSQRCSMHAHSRFTGGQYEHYVDPAIDPRLRMPRSLSHPLYYREVTQEPQFHQRLGMTVQELRRLTLINSSPNLSRPPTLEMRAPGNYPRPNHVVTAYGTMNGMNQRYPYDPAISNNPFYASSTNPWYFHNDQFRPNPWRTYNVLHLTNSWRPNSNNSLRPGFFEYSNPGLHPDNLFRFVTTSNPTTMARPNNPHRPINMVPGIENDFMNPNFQMPENRPATPHPNRRSLQDTDQLKEM